MHRVNSKTHRLWKPQTAKSISALSYLQRLSRKSVSNGINKLNNNNHVNSSKNIFSKPQTQKILHRNLTNSTQNTTNTSRNLSTAAANVATATNSGNATFNGTVDASGQAQRKFVTVEPPKRSSFSCYEPVKCGNGFVIDTMVSDKKVEIPKNQIQPMDGNTSAAYVAYANSEVSFIYPISPATSMGEAMDQMASSGKLNVVSKQPVRVEVMQSEGGAAGAVHGALAAGCLSSTFTASQGLLLMIPNMYLIAGELMPCVMHVSARTLAKQALCIYNDHSDVMAVRQTGWALLSSNTPQEVMDLALVSHLATVKSRIPFLHFFDGNRTSHEIQNIHKIPYESMEKMVNHDLIRAHLRSLSLNPVNPIARGTGQRPDIFWQSNMASERYYRQCTKHIETSMDELETLTGRRYNLFDYYGHPEAERVIVVMGSAAQTTQQFIRSTISNCQDVNDPNSKIGVIKVRCYRPWSAQHFFSVMPPTVKKIAVLDRTREEGSLGNPLFLDVSVSFKEHPTMSNVEVTGGSAGIGQKEITPNMIDAVFANLKSERPKNRYNVGINDDVTFTSLDYNRNSRLNDASLPKDIKQCLFWGLGSDGTVGSTKQSIKIIGENTGQNCQGFFAYDSKKSGGVTLSQLRFGDSKIESEYQITSADYIGIHNTSDQFIKKLDLLQAIKPNGIVVMNSPWNTLEDLNKHLPSRMKRQIAENDVRFYNIDAGHIARSLGLKGRINMIMQSVFYKLGNILESEEQASQLLKNAIVQMFSKKGDEIVNMNISAVNSASDNLIRIKYDKQEWLNATDTDKEIEDWDHLLRAGKPEFVSKIMEPCMSWEGDNLPVSAFEAGGQFPVGTTRYERRGAAPEIPIWLADKCTQCNYCSIVCPHAVIRPFLLNKEEAKAAPKDFQYRKAQGGGEFAGLNYSIQVAPMDCTGCAVCVQSCPDDALYMAEFEQHAHENLPNFEFAMTLPNRQPADKFTVKGSQFEQPLLEYHGACAGCGETPYVKLVTQMFGQQMMIANASGCSSVWGGTCTTHPYTKNKETGRGPAWGRSLFEDNAEYGYGMALASLQRRKRLAALVQDYVNEYDKSGNTDNADTEELVKHFKKWIKTYDNFNENNKVCDDLDRIGLISKLGGDAEQSSKIRQIYNQRDMFRPQSQWLIGGDGWAYDIGSSGLDHVLSKGENINILILDTEIYSNTGGQSSKASTASQVTKFESLGKTRHKKDLGSVAMSYGDVYVASVSLGADYNQTVKAFKEAAEYPGTSIIMAYSPCIDWGIDTKDMADIQRVAVETGYWENYRFDPRLAAKGQNPLQLDSRRIKKPIRHYLESENRFKMLKRQHAERAAALQGSLEDWIQERHLKLQRQSMDDLELLDFLKSQLGEASDNSNKITILYGSETGNANEFSNIIATDLNKRGIRTKVLACDDYDYGNLGKENMILFVIATCGQGQLPANCSEMYKILSEMKKENVESELGSLSDTKIAIFGMGDSHYVYFNEAAKLYDDVFRNKLGAQMIMDDYGKGDDQDDEKYESKWEDWSSELYNKLSLPEAEKILLPASCGIEIHSDVSQVAHELIVPNGASIIPIVENRLLTPPDYDRDTRHYEFDTQGLSYEVGDSLGIYPHNEIERVNEFCKWYGLNADDVIMIEDHNEDRMKKDPFPEHMTVRQLFSQVLDIFGRPKKRFYELLSLVATDENEKGHLMNLSNEEYKYNIGETFDHSDLLRMFPSARPSIEHMIDYIPRIKPRLYSIASSPNEKPDNIALCVVVDDWTTPDRKLYKKGLCSSYLTKQLPNNKNVVVGKVNAGVVAMPDSHELPMVMAGLGTGLAPLRGMVRDRVHAINTDAEVAKTAGPMALYFGARYRKNEFLYESEWEEFHNNGKGPLTHLRTAFSRDQAHKIYIQDRIMEDEEIIHDYLVNKNGYFYACGSSAVQKLKENVAQCLHKVDNKQFPKLEDGQQYVTNMMIEGRYCIESW